MAPRKISAREVLQELKALGDPRVRAPALHKLAREIGTSHKLAQQLWDSGNHEARILAALVDDPARVTAAQMERWARDFDSWDVVDGSCCHLFVFAAPAWRKAVEWSGRKPEFVKRAGFALMAYLAWHDQGAADARFARLLPLIRRHASDERNFVKKAANWALRQIGKRNLRLNRLAVRTARQIGAIDSPAACWVAADALRELTSGAVRRRLRARRLG